MLILNPPPLPPPFLSCVQDKCVMAAEEMLDDDVARARGGVTPKQQWQMTQAHGRAPALLASFKVFP